MQTATVRAARCFALLIACMAILASYSSSKGGNRTPWDHETIEAMMAAVSEDTILTDVRRLQDFYTRESTTDSALAAAQWVYDHLAACSIDSIAWHHFHPDHSPNVVVTIPGVVHPDEICVIGAHYDSDTGFSEAAPGADDNASGVACLIQCARRLTNHQYERTLQLIAFSAEEHQIMGSRAYAEEARLRGDNVVGMVCIDMIGYVAPGDSADLDLIRNSASLWMIDEVTRVRDEFMPEFGILVGDLGWGTGSDHRAYWENSYHAIQFFEDLERYSPYIHTPNDTVGLSFNRPDFATDCTKMAVGAMASLAGPFDVAIRHEPLADTDEIESPYVVTADVLSVSPLDPVSPVLWYKVGPAAGFASMPLAPTGMPDEYSAALPPLPGGSLVRYYLEAGDVDGNVVTHPADAPDTTHEFFIGTITVVFEDDFEQDRGWQVGAPDDDATTGIWVRVDPNRTPFQPEDDHTPDPGVNCFVTGNGEPGDPSGRYDVDDGKTTLLSPILDLSGLPNAWVSYWRWYSNETYYDDEFVVEVSSDSGFTWQLVEMMEESDNPWREFTIELAGIIPFTNKVQFRFVASDTASPSLVEAALDDFRVFSREVEPAGLALTPPESWRSGPLITLQSPCPHPLIPAGRIRFDLGGTVERDVRVLLYDVQGRLVATLFEGRCAPGRHDVGFDPRTGEWGRIAPGMYVVQVRTLGESANQKLVILR